MLDKGLRVLLQELLVIGPILDESDDMTKSIIRLFPAGESGLLTHLYRLAKATLCFGTVVLRLLMASGPNLPVGWRGDLLKERETLSIFKNKIALVVGGMVFPLFELEYKVATKREPSRRVPWVDKVRSDLKMLGRVV